LFKRGVVAVLIILLTACAAPARRAAPAGPPAAGARLESLPVSGTYRIDADRSELRVLVYRSGSLAHLGHNHVLVNRSLSGGVLVGDGLQTSSFSFSAPVDKFVVDDADARREEGGDFSGEVPADAKAGTLHNMLSAAQFNAAQYPVLAVKSIGIDLLQGAPTATLSVRVAGHDSTITAPFALAGAPGQLTATGAFELRQSALGITPYSLLGGALQVQDALSMKIKIVASLER
jgi:hypothetical protein